TVADLTAHLGVPSCQSVSADRRSQFFGYGADCGVKYQVKNQVVVSSSRKPKDQERALQFWLHRWKGVTTRYAPMPETRDPHGHTLYQLVAPGLGMTVVYDRERDQVEKVVEYAPIQKD